MNLEDVLYKTVFSMTVALNSILLDCFEQSIPISHFATSLSTEQCNHNFESIKSLLRYYKKKKSLNNGCL